MYRWNCKFYSCSLKKKFIKRSNKMQLILVNTYSLSFSLSYIKLYQEGERKKIKYKNLAFPIFYNSFNK